MYSSKLLPVSSRYTFFLPQIWHVLYNFAGGLWGLGEGWYHRASLGAKRANWYGDGELAGSCSSSKPMGAQRTSKKEFTLLYLSKLQSYFLHCQIEQVAILPRQSSFLSSVYISHLFTYSPAFRHSTMPIKPSLSLYNLTHTSPLSCLTLLKITAILHRF